MGYQYIKNKDYCFELIPIVSIKGIEYILYDKDGFKLARDKIEEKIIDFEKNETFRRTSI